MRPVVRKSENVARFARKFMYLSLERGAFSRVEIWPSFEDRHTFLRSDLNCACLVLVLSSEGINGQRAKISRKLCASAFHPSKIPKKGTKSGRLRRPLCVRVFRVLEGGTRSRIVFARWPLFLSDDNSCTNPLYTHAAVVAIRSMDKSLHDLVENYPEITAKLRAACVAFFQAILA